MLPVAANTIYREDTGSPTLTMSAAGRQVVYETGGCPDSTSRVNSEKWNGVAYELFPENHP